MLLKNSPEDFRVNEIYDLEQIKSKKEEGEDSGIFYYFILKKTNYEQVRCLRYVAKLFGKKIQDVHFCGTKDKVAITTQIISIKNLKKSNLEKNVEYINEKIKDIDVEYIGEFNSRINLGDNVGNSFEIKLREITKEDLENFNMNLKKYESNGFKFLNFFETQRFGFSGNNHIVGKHILKNEMKEAIYEILSSTPAKPSEELETFVNFVKKYKFEIYDEKLDECISLVPSNFENYKVILEELKKRKNDFTGALKTFPKKIQTIFINAYQSHIFNNVLKKIELDELDEITLVNYNSKNNEDIEEIENKILENDGLTKRDFMLAHIPTLSNDRLSKRKVYSTIKNFKYELDEKENILILKFDLGSGEYATNIVNQLFLNLKN